ncbi:MAG: DUF1549 and DUF1553 domain-containing protein [Acidobacteriota bacterium]|nr:DUF1549 and DUF1553 domain-containing protein [Acidobacteriota bacterium]
MNRVLFLFGVSALLGFASDDSTPSKPTNDLPEMPAAAHAPLFRPKTPSAGRVTERLTSDLPKPIADASPVAHRNFIDDEIFGKMRRDAIPHAPLSTDREFIRRVKLDVAGRIPSPAEVRDFLNDKSPDKRAKLIDSLVGGPEFVDKWSYFFMDILRANGKMGRGYVLFHYTLKESLAADRPYDDWARSIIAASAKSNYVVAAANPIVREHVEGKPGEVADGDDLSKVNQLDTHDELSILYAKIFLGMNISCISCHDGAGHLEKVNVYLSQRKRSDFFQESAFLARTRYIPHVEHSAAVMGHFLVDDSGAGYDTKADSMLRTKRTGGPNTPKFLLTDEAARPDAEPRHELGRMLTENPQFARAAVNMFWAKLMGVCIVDPYDEFDLARLDPKNLPPGWDAQPSNPELLEKLATYFRENNYSVHKLFKLICNSSAYQLSARFPGEWKETYTKYYARKFARMLTAEELHDAIVTATERPGKFVVASKNEDGSSDGGAPASVPMAMQVSMPQPKGELKSFMAAFGESNRGAPPRAPSPSPLQPIMMMKSSVVNDRVLAKKDSRVERLLDSYKDNGKVVDQLFLATLSREPMPAERELALNAMEKDRVEGAQNLQWALLNVVEFLYNF